MKRVLAALALVAASVISMPQEPPFELESFWWVYFVCGAAREAYSDEQHEQMLSEHVGNLERIWKGGSRSWAGRLPAMAHGAESSL